MAFDDMVMLLPGISGSTLSRDGKYLWGTSASALLRAIFSGGDSINSLQLPPGALDNDHYDDGVVATSLVSDLHLVPGLWKIDGYTKVARYLTKALSLQRGQNFIEFPYDWRFDNRRSARRLKDTADTALHRWRIKSGKPEAKIVFVAHSMGGLVARYFIENLEGWRDTRALITFGTPYSGSLNALGFICEGFKKGPLDFSNVLRSFDSVYQLLPTYKCVDVGEPSGLQALTEDLSLPHLSVERTLRARLFHDDIAKAHRNNGDIAEYRDSPYAIHPVVGTFQRTHLSASFAHGEFQLQSTYDGCDQGGDGTVPRVSATPPEQKDVSRAMFTEHLHGSLQNIDAVLEQVRGVLTARQVQVFRGRKALLADVHYGLFVDDFYEVGQTARFVVEPARLAEGVRERVQAANVAGMIEDASTGQPQTVVNFRRDIDGLYRGETKLSREGDFRLVITSGDKRPRASDSFAVIKI